MIRLYKELMKPSPRIIGEIECVKLSGAVRMVGPVNVTKQCSYGFADQQMGM